MQGFAVIVAEKGTVDWMVPAHDQPHRQNQFRSFRTQQYFSWRVDTVGDYEREAEACVIFD